MMRLRPRHALLHILAREVNLLGIGIDPLLQCHAGLEQRQGGSDVSGHHRHRLAQSSYGLQDQRRVQVMAPKTTKW